MGTVGPMKIVLVLIASLAYAEPVPRAVWVESFKTGFANYICKSGEFFRECFNVTERECLEEALRATKTCLADKGPSLPDPIKLPEEGTKWGSVVGSCAGSAYEIGLKARGKRKESAECNNPSLWLPGAKRPAKAVRLPKKKA